MGITIDFRDENMEYHFIERGANSQLNGFSRLYSIGAIRKIEARTVVPAHIQPGDLHLHIGRNRNLINQQLRTGGQIGNSQLGAEVANNTNPFLSFIDRLSCNMFGLTNSTIDDEPVSQNQHAANTGAHSQDPYHELTEELLENVGFSSSKLVERSKLYNGALSEMPNVTGEGGDVLILERGIDSQRAQEISGFLTERAEDLRAFTTVTPTVETEQPVAQPVAQPERLLAGIEDELNSSLGIGVYHTEGGSSGVIEQVNTGLLVRSRRNQAFIRTFRDGTVDFGGNDRLISTQQQRNWLLQTTDVPIYFARSYDLTQCYIGTDKDYFLYENVRKEVELDALLEGPLNRHLSGECSCTVLSSHVDEAFRVLGVKNKEFQANYLMDITSKIENNKFIPIKTIRSTRNEGLTPKQLKQRNKRVGDSLLAHQRDKFLKGHITLLEYFEEVKIGLYLKGLSGTNEGRRYWMREHKEMTALLEKRKKKVDEGLLYITKNLSRKHLNNHSSNYFNMVLERIFYRNQEKRAYDSFAPQSEIVLDYVSPFTLHTADKGVLIKTYCTDKIPVWGDLEFEGQGKGGKGFYMLISPSGEEIYIGEDKDYFKQHNIELTESLDKELYLKLTSKLNTATSLDPKSIIEDIIDIYSLKNTTFIDNYKAHSKKIIENFLEEKITKDLESFLNEIPQIIEGRKSIDTVLLDIDRHLNAEEIINNTYCELVIKTFKEKVQEQLVSEYLSDFPIHIDSVIRGDVTKEQLLEDLENQIKSHGDIPQTTIERAKEVLSQKIDERQATIAKYVNTISPLRHLTVSVIAGHVLEKNLHKGIDQDFDIPSQDRELLKVVLSKYIKEKKSLIQNRLKKYNNFIIGVLRGDMSMERVLQSIIRLEDPQMPSLAVDFPSASRQNKTQSEENLPLLSNKDLQLLIHAFEKEHDVLARRIKGYLMPFLPQMKKVITLGSTGSENFQKELSNLLHSFRDEFIEKNDFPDDLNLLIVQTMKGIIRNQIEKQVNQNTSEIRTNAVRRNVFALESSVGQEFKEGVRRNPIRPTKI